MGSGNTKDGYIDIFLQTNQQIYTAGTYVDGTVYINCKGTRNYKNLILKLQGVEYVHWSQGSGKNRRSYTNKKDTYNGVFQLAIFSTGIIAGGHYSFPFKFLLPSQLPGSMFQSASCYIRYPLSAQLHSSDGKNDPQIYTKYLNVLQPIRSPLGMIQKQQIVSPQCCGCCKDYGVVKVGLSCDKNFVMAGQIIQVSGYIDNSGGKDKITNCTVSFLDKRWKISSGGAIRNHVLNNSVLFTAPSQVYQGQNVPFNFSATIPAGLVFSTAIGSIVSRYQTLCLTTSIGCCATDPTVQFPLIFHTNSQQIQVSPQVPPPPGWNPIVTNQVLCNTFPVFYYQPNINMPYLNRQGKSNNKMLNEMSNQGGYYQQQPQIMNMY